MRAIYRYEVPVDDCFHEFDLTGDPLAVDCRISGVVEFWAIRDDDAPEVQRGFLVVGTGHPLPVVPIKHWGTARDLGGALIWHLIEATS